MISILNIFQYFSGFRLWFGLSPSQQFNVILISNQIVYLSLLLLLVFSVPWFHGLWSLSYCCRIALSVDRLALNVVSMAKVMTTMSLKWTIWLFSHSLHLALPLFFTRSKKLKISLNEPQMFSCSGMLLTKHSFYKLQKKTGAKKNMDSIDWE